MIREVNRRMLLFPRHEDFQIPYCGGKYWPDHSKVQAKEHRNVMQIAPFLFVGIDNDLCELCAR